MKHEPLVGCHVSIAGGIHKVFDRGESVDCTAIQIFTKSNRNWFDKKLEPEEIEKFKAAAKQSSIKAIVAHTGYLINIGSNKEATAQQSTNSLLDEIRRCQELGVKVLVLHPGSHLGAGEESCIKQIAHKLDHVLEQSDGTVTIALETMAGQGTNIGYTFEQLKEIRSLCKHKRKIGFCLDTCHVFAANYDISTEDGYKETFKQFDAILGLEHLKVIHMNDSQTKLGSRVDRHAPLGKGYMKLETFDRIMNDKKLIDVPKILETPSDPDMKLWAQEIALLKKMVGA
jgi:deoxyribonuclease IV